MQKKVGPDPPFLFHFSIGHNLPNIYRKDEANLTTRFSEKVGQSSAPTAPGLG